jgi:TDG/mug DNA glycosylase family protein
LTEWASAGPNSSRFAGNKFYPALRLAGIIDRSLDRAEGMTDEDRCS